VNCSSLRNIALTAPYAQGTGGAVANAKTTSFAGVLED